MPTLPLEILYEIFDEEEGTMLLKEASLVCKALQRHAQKLLFKDYRMDGGAALDYEIKPIFSSPHLLQHIRIVRLQSARYAHTIGAWQYRNIDAAVKVLRRLPMDQIIGFDLNGLAFEDAQRSPIGTSQRDFVELIIQLCNAPNLRALNLSCQDCRLLPQCGPSVKELTVLNEHWTHHQNISSPTRSGPMALTTLAIINNLFGPNHSISSLDYVLGPGNMISLNSLESFSTVVRPHSADAVRKVLECGQQSLTKLDLNFTSVTNDLDAFGLGQLRALKLLDIHAPFPYDDEPDILPWLYGELCNALEFPLPLEELSIHFQVEEFEFSILDTSLWAQFSSLLANRDALPCLLLFMFEIKGRVGDQVLSDISTAFEGLGNPEISSTVDRKGLPMVSIYWDIVE
ncbi:hypothetical protein BKA70DRAFT_454008 [Coprinopsis sp. MPI-PUGE-AT-0042]|nr:hypothetical protein BKA70DRAFT_454008 [Coprinopsis sp. MPI-PUGE-AT-0042]